MKYYASGRMHWIAPSERDAATDALEKRLWAAADQLRANSGLTSQQYGLLGIWKQEF